MTHVWFTFIRKILYEILLNALMKDMKANEFTANWKNTFSFSITALFNEQFFFVFVFKIKYYINIFFLFYNFINFLFRNESHLDSKSVFLLCFLSKWKPLLLCDPIRSSKIRKKNETKQQKTNKQNNKILYMFFHTRISITLLQLQVRR